MPDYDPAVVIEHAAERERQFLKHFGDRRSNQYFPTLQQILRSMYFAKNVIEMGQVVDQLRRNNISPTNLRLYADVVEFVGENYISKRGTDELLTNFRSELYHRLRRLGF